MYLFLIFLFPVVLITYLILNLEKKQILVSFTSFIISVFYCLVVGLFGNFYRLVPVNFFQNFAFIFCCETLFPILILLLVFYFWSEDDFSYKIKCVFPLLVGFYAVYMPFMILFENSELNWFSLFVKPILFISMFIGLSSVVSLLYYSMKNKGNKLIIVLYFLLVVFFMILPAVIETLWLDGFSIFMFCLMVCVYILSACYCGFIAKKQEKKS